MVLPTRTCAVCSVALNFVLLPLCYSPTDHADQGRERGAVLGLAGDAEPGVLSVEGEPRGVAPGAGPGPRVDAVHHPAGRRRGGWQPGELGMVGKNRT